MGDVDVADLVAGDLQSPDALSPTHTFSLKGIKIVIFISCAACGSMMPVLTDWTKESPSSYVSEDGESLPCGGLEHQIFACRRQILYIPTVQVFVSVLACVVVYLSIVAVVDGKHGYRLCVESDRVALTFPIALSIAAGDVVTLFAISASSATVYMVVGQAKLLCTALVSGYFVGTTQSVAQWIMLVAITVTSILYCDLVTYFVGGDKKAAGELELMGIILSLIKVVLVSFNGVLSQRSAQSYSDESVWVNQARLKLLSLPPALLFLVGQEILYPWMTGGKVTLLEESQGAWIGWSNKVTVLVIAGLLNSAVLGLLYKYMDAVAKYLAYAQSLWITYLVNAFMDDTAIHFDLLLVILLLVMLVVTYALAKVPKPALHKPVIVLRHETELSRK